MPKPNPKLTAEALVTADYYLREQPTRGWENNAACKDISPDKLPQEASGGAQQRMRATRLIGQFCSGCTVREDCARKPLGDSFQPTGMVYGGYDVEFTGQLWKAARAITRAGGSTEAAAGKAGIEIAGVAPVFPFDVPPDAVPFTPAAPTT